MVVKFPGLSFCLTHLRLGAETQKYQKQQQQKPKNGETGSRVKQNTCRQQLPQSTQRSQTDSALPVPMAAKATRSWVFTLWDCNEMLSRDPGLASLPNYIESHPSSLIQGPRTEPACHPSKQRGGTRPSLSACGGGRMLPSLLPLAVNGLPLLLRIQWRLRGGQ